MHSPLRAYPTVVVRRMTPWVRRLTRPAGVIIIAALVQGCMTQLPLTRSDPAHPSARAKGTAYRSDIAPYESRRPVDPKPWVEQNQQVAPAPRP
jgi:hypothetical protein